MMSEPVEIDAVAARETGNGTPKKSSRRARPKLTRAAEQFLDQKSDEIAKSLAESAAKGSVQSARLLLELADMPSEEEKEGKRQPSLADRWSAEPPWTGPDEEDSFE